MSRLDDPLGKSWDLRIEANARLDSFQGYHYCLVRPGHGRYDASQLGLADDCIAERTIHLDRWANPLSILPLYWTSSVPNHPRSRTHFWELVRISRSGWRTSLISPRSMMICELCSRRPQIFCRVLSSVSTCTFKGTKNSLSRRLMINKSRRRRGTNGRNTSEDVMASYDHLPMWSLGTKPILYVSPSC